MGRIESKKELLYSDISETIIGYCFEIMRKLGAGFLENVYKNALFIAMGQKGLNVLAEQPFELLVNFGQQKLEYKRLHHPDRLYPNNSKNWFSAVSKPRI